MTNSRNVRLFGVDDPTHRGDPDGLIAAAGLAALPGDEAELLGLVANRAPATRRAAAVRYALDRHGAHVPVGIGEEIGTARDADLAASPFEADAGSTGGYELCERVLAGCAPGSVRGFFISPFREAAWLIERPELWRAFERVAIMGGINPVGWGPDSAFNNRADPAAAERFYRRLQEIGTPVTLVDRSFALWAKVPKQVWLDAAGSSDPWVAEIGAAMRHQWERMWDGVSSGQLPSDRTPEWFLDNWCDGARPQLARGASITPHVTGAPAYDVLAVATLLDDAPLGRVETHPAFPNFHVLRPDPSAGPERAVAAQLRLIRAALARSDA